MITNIYAIYDSKAEHHSNPMFFINDEIAIRAVTDAVNNPETDYAKHPEDYNLFLLGKYDDSSAIIESHEPKHIISLHTV